MSSDTLLTWPEPSASKRRGLSILALNTDLPIFPGGGGVEFLTMKNLAGRARQVGLVSMAHAREDLNRSRALKDAGVRLYLWRSPSLDRPPGAVPQPSIAGIIRGWVQNLARAAYLPSGRPTDTLIMDAAFRNMAPGLLQALSEQPWHVLSVVQSSAASMIDYVPRPLVSVLVMHDIRARLYERRAEVANSAVERWRLRREARTYRAFERTYCQKFDLVVTVSAEDAQWIQEQYGPPRVYVLPLPVDSGYFAPQPREVEREGRILFTGLMNHPPNEDAAIYFAAELLPHIQAHDPSVEFHVVGRNPSDRVKELGRLPGVRIFANVPDIRPHIAEASVVVVPLRFGSGARQKILEAWGMEKCVVATSIGAEGLEYRAGINLLVANTAATFADAVTTALSDRQLRDRLGKSGRSITRKHHDPRRLADAYYTELERVAAEKNSFDQPMRVLLDMRWMVPGVAGGIENLAGAFLRQLMLLDRCNAYTAILPARCRYDFDLRGRANFRIISLDSVTAQFRRQLDRITSRVCAALRLPDWRSPEVRGLKWLRKLEVEIAVSFPGYIHPGLNPLRHVLVIPDIQHEYLPEFFTPAALEERRRLYTESARRADHICAISEFTRRTLIDKLCIPSEKITTVPLAADPMFSTIADATEDAGVLDRYGLEPGQYIYFPAHTWHHKNHRTAIEALQILCDRYRRRITLVCSGGPREAQPQLDEQIAKANLTDQVRFLGYCQRHDLSALYRQAACLLFPSLFEGFGMPVLEAMASGCPVVCSNTTSLPEIAGDAALLVSPQDPDALAEAMRRVLTDVDLRRQLVERGLQRATNFSWTRHTLETIAVIRQVRSRTRMI